MHHVCVLDRLRSQKPTSQFGQKGGNLLRECEAQRGPRSSLVLLFALHILPASLSIVYHSSNVHPEHLVSRPLHLLSCHYTLLCSIADTSRLPEIQRFTTESSDKAAGELDKASIACRKVGCYV